MQTGRAQETATPGRNPSRTIKPPACPQNRKQERWRRKEKEGMVVVGRDETVREKRRRRAGCRAQGS
eukprot:22865-Pleurochrysis_carterae.AAC.1